MGAASTIDSPTYEEEGPSSQQSPIPRIVFSSSLSGLPDEDSRLMVPKNHSSYDSLGYASNEENPGPYFSYLRRKTRQQHHQPGKPLPTSDDDASWTYYDSHRCVSGCFMVAILALSVLCCSMVLHWERREDSNALHKLRATAKVTSTTPTSAGILLPQQNDNTEISNFDKLPYTKDSYSNTEMTLSDIASKALTELNAPRPHDHYDAKGSMSNSPCKVTVVLVRHCNDYGLYASSDNPQDAQEIGYKHCSYLGYQQANFLSHNLFNGQHWPRPSALYALVPPMKKTKGRQQLPGTNLRQVETLLPLATENNLQIHMVASPRQAGDYIFDTLRRHPTTNETNTPSKMCGTVSVVAWKHAFIPELAAYLGCSKCPNEWPSDDDFDTVWMLQYVWNPPKPSHEDDFVQQYQQYLIDDGDGYSGSILANELAQGRNNATTPVEESLHSDSLSSENHSRHRGLQIRAKSKEFKKFSNLEEGASGANDRKLNEDGSRGSWALYHQVATQHFDPLLVSTSTRGV